MTIAIEFEDAAEGMAVFTCSQAAESQEEAVAKQLDVLAKLLSKPIASHEILALDTCEDDGGSHNGETIH